MATVRQLVSYKRTVESDKTYHSSKEALFWGYVAGEHVSVLLERRCSDDGGAIWRRTNGYLWDRAEGINAPSGERQRESKHSTD